MILPTWFLFAALLTEVMAAVVGFGSSTILTPIATLFLDIKTALAIVAIFHATGALVRFLRFRPAVDWSFFRGYGVPAVGATLIGALLVRTISSDSLALLLGLFLVAFVLFIWSHPHFHLPQRRPDEAVAGVLTGFFGGLLGAGGGIRSAFLQAFGMKKEEYVGESALLALAVDFTRIPVYLASGYLTGIPTSWIVILMILAVFGTLFGLSIVDRLPQKAFRLIVLIAVLAVALKLVADGI